MNRFIFFTKTIYSEPPRIRHQLAHLLTSFGHEVIFYQKPLYFFQKDKTLVNKKIDKSLTVKQTKELIHHQLRVIPPLAGLNSIYETKKIKNSLGEFFESDIIINFNYDYTFLRNIFKNNKIITLINDDFIAQAKINRGKHVFKSLSKTLRISNHVLTVSYPLYNQAKQFTNDTHLFLPWATTNYSTPTTGIRDSILLWSYLDRKIDIKLLDILLANFPEYNFDIVGPSSNNTYKELNKLALKYRNINLIPACQLDSLPIDKYFCSILPYRTGIKHVEAVTAANKTFQLLSKGLPLITHGMPNFLEHDAIFKSDSYTDFSNNIAIANKLFNEFQPKISKLVDENTSSVRYNQIMTIINK